MPLIAPPRNSLLTIDRMFVPHTPPEETVDSNLDAQKDNFIRQVPSPPTPDFAHSVSSSSFALKSASTLTMTATDTISTNVRVNSLALRTFASDADNALFIALSGVDNTTGNPTTNVGSYLIGGGRSNFKIAGAKLARISDSTLTARVTSVEPEGHRSRFAGPRIQISGTANDVAGSSNIRLTASSARKPDNATAADVFTTLTVTKSWRNDDKSLCKRQLDAL